MSNYRFSRPVTALLALTIPLWYVPAAVWHFRSAIKADLVSSGRDVVAALRWSIVDPVKAFFARTASNVRTASIAAGQKANSLIDRIAQGLDWIVENHIRFRLASILVLAIYPVLFVARLLALEEHELELFAEELRDEFVNIVSMLTKGRPA